MSSALLLLWVVWLPWPPLPPGLGRLVKPVSPVEVAPPSSPLPAPLAMRETARYRVGYGLLGAVGEVRVTVEEERTDRGSRLVRAQGAGEGAILGLGRIQKRIGTDFDPTGYGSRRWISERVGSDKTIVDVIEQPRPGVMDFARQRNGGPMEKMQATFAIPTLDPLGFLLRVRVSPPAPGQSQVVQLIDGQALWRLTLTAAGRESLPDSEGRVAAQRFDCRAEPIFYDGRPDGRDRTARAFALWLSDDQARIPLRLEMPIGPSDVVVQLVELSRTPR